MIAEIGEIVALDFETGGGANGKVKVNRARKEYLFFLSKKEKDNLNPFVGQKVIFDIEYQGDIVRRVRKYEPEQFSAPVSVVHARQDRSESGGGLFISYRVIFILLALVIWIYLGMPNPLLFFSGSDAKAQCVQLAEENLDHILPFMKADKVEAGNDWMKDGRRVVQLIVTEAGTEKQFIRLCLYGRGSVEIPSIIEQGRWN